MSALNSLTLDQININEDHAFVTLITPKAGSHTMPELTALFQANRQFFMDKVAQRGVLISMPWSTRAWGSSPGTASTSRACPPL
jgi:hypothetical protein